MIDGLLGVLERGRAGGDEAREVGGRRPLRFAVRVALAVMLAKVLGISQGDIDDLAAAQIADTPIRAEHHDFHKRLLNVGSKATIIRTHLSGSFGRVGVTHFEFSLATQAVWKPHR